MSTRTRRVLFGLVGVAHVITAIASVWIDPAEATGELGAYLLLPVFFVIGVLIVEREPRNPIGWIFVGAFTFEVLDNLFTLGAKIALDQPYPIAPTWETALGFMAAYLDNIANVIVWWSLLIFPAAYFPNGRLPSPRWRLFPRAVGVALVLNLILGIFNPEIASPLFPDFHNPLAVPIIQRFTIVPDLVLIIASVIAPLSVVVRFRKARGIERQQIKWPLFSALVGVIGLGSILIFGFAFGSGLEDLEGSVFAQVLIVLEVAYVLSFPITIGIAILRYRLYDIDIIIRKTIQYTLVSGILVLTYFGVVTQLEAVLRAVTGQESPLAVVISTLTIAALFNPLRRRVQSFIDRRFYRQKYDAERVLKAFSSTLREEVDLDQLRNSIVGVVEETMQPEQVSLWLKQRDGKRRGGFGG